MPFVYKQRSKVINYMDCHESIAQLYGTLPIAIITPLEHISIVISV